MSYTTPDRPRLRSFARRSQGAVNLAAAPLAVDDDVELVSYLHVLRDHIRLIVAVTCGVALIAIAYAVLARPVYEASMLIHVEEAGPAVSKNALNEVASMFETKKGATAEMELLRSRMVVTPAVERLKLYIHARPDYFPLLGQLVRDARPGELSSPGLFGIGGYLWGSEQIEVPVFDVPAALLGRDFAVTVISDEEFIVTESSAGIRFKGRVGPPLRITLPAGEVAIQVARVAGRPGARFLLTRVSAVKRVRQLQKDLIIAEQGKQSGVIEARLEGPDPVLVNAVLQEIGHQYIAQNISRKSEEAERSLAFLELQLPKLKASLEAAEEKYNAFRNANGTIEFAEEAKQSVQQASAAKLRRTELIQKRAEMLTRFTARHPVIAALNDQLSAVNQDIIDIARRIKSLPSIEQTSLRLSRDIKINTDLYTSLANSAQQLKIVSVGSVSNVRLVDPPVLVDEPIRPHRALIIGGGLAGGLLLGVAIVFVRRALRGGVEDPMRIERLLGGRVVFANIPHSEAQARLQRSAQRGGKRALLALEWPTDGAVEALRSFRTSLEFSLPQFHNNVMVLAGPTPNLGKSFISANFAAVMAASRRRILLIDADVRNGQLHHYFGCIPTPGLCEVITGAATLSGAIRRGVLDNLDLLPIGSLLTDQPDLFLHADIGAMLAAAGESYDLVVVDSPPVLALADALVLAGHAGAVFLVLRAGVSTERDITEAVKRLNQAGVSPLGILFNDVKPRLSGYGYQYDQYNVAKLGFAGSA
ncbi:MAG: polysaccharide biosynthesis tyrosine autokinase [Massilia sp.]